MTSLLKWLATNAINWDTGQHSTLGTQKPQSQVTSLPSRWFNRTEVGTLQPARLSQITIMGLEPRVQLDGAGRFKNFLVDTGDTYSVLISYSGGFSSQTCTVLGATGKTTTKRFTRALLCCWDGQIFFHQFLVVPECPTPFLKRDLSLPSISCNYCGPDRRYFKTLLGTNYFYQSPSETTLEWERPFMDF